MPTSEELAGSGFEPADYALPPVEVWPVNWRAFCFFADLRTQWRVAMGGATGLDYPAVIALMGLYEVPQADRVQLMDDIRVMESAALAQMSVKYT